MANNTKYNSKRDDSFKTKYKLFLFKKAFEIQNLNDLVNSNVIEKEFENFKVDKELASLYSSQYYQKEDDDKIIYNKIELVCENIWKVMNIYQDINLFNLFDNKKKLQADVKYQEFFDKLKNNHNKTFKDTFAISDFSNMTAKNTCSYCGISKDQIEKLGENGKLHNKRSETRGYTLEIDRKEPNLEYTEDNCCMSCYWCNNAKTDEFIPSEFEGIARGINTVWNERFEKIKSTEKVCFPEDSDIWKIKVL